MFKGMWYLSKDVTLASLSSLHKPDQLICRHKAEIDQIAEPQQWHTPAILIYPHTFIASLLYIYKCYFIHCTPYHPLCSMLQLVCLALGILLTKITIHIHEITWSRIQVGIWFQLYHFCSCKALKHILAVNYKRYSYDQRLQFVHLHNEDASISQLYRWFKIRKQIIRDILSKHATTGSVVDRHRSGRPKKTTPREDRILRRLSAANPTHVSRRLNRNWQNTTDARVSARTVRWRLV